MADKGVFYSPGVPSPMIGGAEYYYYLLPKSSSDMGGTGIIPYE